MAADEYKTVPGRITAIHGVASDGSQSGYADNISYSIAVDGEGVSFDVVKPNCRRYGTEVKIFPAKIGSDCTVHIRGSRYTFEVIEILDVTGEC